jgi:hypothetical protein
VFTSGAIQGLLAGFRQLVIIERNKSIDTDFSRPLYRLPSKTTHENGSCHVSDAGYSIPTDLTIAGNLPIFESKPSAITAADHITARSPVKLAAAYLTRVQKQIITVFGVFSAFKITAAITHIPSVPFELTVHHRSRLCLLSNASYALWPAPRAIATTVWSLDSRELNNATLRPANSMG